MDQPALLYVELPAEVPLTVRCRWCRRPLRDAESRALAEGTTCHDRIAPRRDWAIDQDALPGV